eukprot:CAMPEP_0176252858 /NCGR_PEP_ID=MMETSP0121_2-20121125/35719_1 /TAXON_ID=160619 /ORGANISM="Kryptoperidinium foliaceum, Strain CCMP 1326" /LENGTH=190 /DNA_ID=CAMNT_0017592621 /DNA_START=79 /DNA_END=651 /DNA_ORIENTATION=-
MRLVGSLFKWRFSTTSSKSVVPVIDCEFDTLGPPVTHSATEPGPEITGRGILSPRHLSRLRPSVGRFGLARWAGRVVLGSSSPVSPASTPGRGLRSLPSTTGTGVARKGAIASVRERCAPHSPVLLGETMPVIPGQSAHTHECGGRLGRAGQLDIGSRSKVPHRRPASLEDLQKLIDDITIHRHLSSTSV